MGRGNFVNPKGFQFYIDYPTDCEDCEIMLEDIKLSIGSVLKDKFFGIDEWDGKYLHNFLESDTMKIGFADNENSVAICFSPRITNKETYDKRTIPDIKRVIERLLSDGYEVRGRCSAWTSGSITTVNEAINFCDFNTAVEY